MLDTPKEITFGKKLPHPPTGDFVSMVNKTDRKENRSSVKPSLEGR
jgi:hypothetical protein